MRNSATMTTNSSKLLNRLSDLDLDPKSLFAPSSKPPHTLIEDEDEQPRQQQQQRDETVGGKWEDLQYYEAKKWTAEDDGQAGQNGQQGGGSQVDSSYSSLTSASTTSSSTTNKDSAGGGGGSGGGKDKRGLRGKLTKIRRKIRGHFSKDKKAESSAEAPAAAAPPAADLCGQVSTAPDPDGVGSSLGSRIRASKSMQNLEQMTRDSYYNLIGATSSLKERYHSRAELRQAKPKTHYAEFWDEDSDMDEDELHRQAMQMVGLC